MISINKEEKLLKLLGILPFVFLLFMANAYSDVVDDVNFAIFIGCVLLFCLLYVILFVRKYHRDKKVTKDS